MRPKDHFGWLAGVFDRSTKPLEDPFLMEALVLPVRGAILDVAGGTGRLAQLLLNESRLVAVADLSFRMVQRAHQKPGVLAACALAESLPFPAACFDRVVMVDAYHHLADQSGALEEMWRLVKPGGRIVIEEPDVRSFLVKLIWLLELLLLMGSHFHTAEEIARGLIVAGAQCEIRKEGYQVWVVARKA